MVGTKSEFAPAARTGGPPVELRPVDECRRIRDLDLPPPTANVTDGLVDRRIGNDLRGLGASVVHGEGAVGVEEGQVHRVTGHCYVHIALVFGDAGGHVVEGSQRVADRLTPL